MVRLVDELETGVKDLKGIDAKQDIANAFTVKLLEEKLPKPIFKKWVETEDSLDTSEDRFEAMFTFLKKQRKQSERTLVVHNQNTASENTHNRNNQNRDNQNRDNRNDL